jgi:tetratricopeptide (TPR) repeat protein
MGARHTSIEDPIGYEMHLNYADFPHRVLKHEMAHLFSANIHPILKMSIKIGLHEGLAVAADWDEDRLTPHQWASAMKLIGVMPSIKRIMGATGFWSESSTRAYNLAGSFVRFLIDRHGIEKFKGAFPTGSFRNHYGKDIDELIDEWLVFLDTVELSDPEDINYAKNALVAPPIIRSRFPRQVAKILEEARSRMNRRDYRGASELFAKAHKLDSSRVGALYQIALCSFRMAEYEDTHRYLQEVIDYPGLTPLYEMMARELMGDVFWQTGQVGEAEASYGRALGIKASKSIERGLRIKLAAIENLPSGKLIMGAMISDSSMMARVADLSAALRGENSKEIPLYLIGRWLVMSGEHERSLRYLNELTMPRSVSRMPNDDFRYESFRLKGLALYRMGRIGEASAAFESMRLFAMCKAEANRSDDWLERCRWEGNLRGDNE